MKTKSVLHNLSPADQTFVIDLCSKHTYARVVELLREPRPTGLALNTSITALSRFYAFFHPALSAFDVNHQDATHVNQRDHSEILPASFFLIQQRIFRGLFNDAPLDQLLPTMRFMLRFRSTLLHKPDDLVSGRARRQIDLLTSKLAERDAQLKRLRAKQSGQNSPANRFQKRTQPASNPSPQPVLDPVPPATSHPASPAPANPPHQESNPHSDPSSDSNASPSPSAIIPMPEEQSTTPSTTSPAPSPSAPAPLSPSPTRSSPVPSRSELVGLAQAFGFKGTLPDVNPFEMDLKKAKPLELIAGLLKLDSIQKELDTGDEPFAEDESEHSGQFQDAEPNPKIIPSHFNFPSVSAKNT